MNHEDQIRLARIDAPLALNRVNAMISEHRAEIIATAIAEIDGGYESKGDTGFRKTLYELDRDTIDDLGAAVARQIMRRHPKR